MFIIAIHKYTFTFLYKCDILLVCDFVYPLMKGWNTFMKKWIPALLSVVVLAFSLPTAVIAENGNDPVTTAVTSGTSEKTSGGETTATKNSELSFSFTYIDDHSITVKWNAKENIGTSVQSVKIGSEEFPVNDETGMFDVDFSSLDPGNYSMTYILSDGKPVAASSKVQRGGDLATDMSLSFNNGRLEAKLTDQNGNPVASYPIRLYIDGVESAGGKTNSSGIFSAIVSSSANEIVCDAEDQTIGTIHYTGCKKSISVSGDTTNNDQKTTAKAQIPTSSVTKANSDNDKSTAATTAATYAVINGAGTTKISGDNIAVNVSFDTQVAKNFDYSNTDFAARSRMLINKNAYSNIVGDSTASLMLLAKTPANPVTTQNISAAINGKSKYSSYNAEDTKSVSLDLSMILYDKAQDDTTLVSAPDTEVTVELPVPKSMSDSKQYKKIVAAVYDDTGITNMIEADVKDGSIQFKTKQLSTIAILGFKTPENLNTKGGGIPTFSLIMIITGLLLLGGAVTLLYFFFLRKPIPADDTRFDTMPLPEPYTGTDENSKDDSEPKLDTGKSLELDQTREFPEDNGVDIYSGAPLKDKQDILGKSESPEKKNNESVPGVSLGSLANQPKENNTNKKNPSDYNIDL